MKVMMFAPTFGQNGKTHVHCERYVRLLQLAGCDVTLVEHGTVPGHLPRVDYREYPRRFRLLQGILGSRTINAIHQRRLTALHRLVAPDICHVQWIDDQLWEVSCAGLRPLVATAWGSDLNVTARASANGAQRRKIATALGRVDLLIVDSDDMAATAERLAGKALKTQLLPIGIDTTQFRPDMREERRKWREKLHIAHDATVLISPRQLGANYRQHEIISAFAAMGSSPGGACLIVRTFGHATGTSLGELQTLVDQLGVSDRIRWIGDLEYAELPGLYAACDLALNFPVMDAFPVTFMECFASGIPVITNRLDAYQSNGALPFLICTGSDSVADLAKATESAIADLSRLRSIAVAARDHAVRHYDERVTALRLKEIYAELLGD